MAGNPRQVLAKTENGEVLNPKPTVNTEPQTLKTEGREPAASFREEHGGDLERPWFLRGPLSLRISPETD